MAHIILPAFEIIRPKRQKIGHCYLDLRLSSLDGVGRGIDLIYRSISKSESDGGASQFDHIL